MSTYFEKRAWKQTQDLRAAIQGFEDAALNVRKLVIKFEICEDADEDNNLGVFDVTIDDVSDGKHIFSDLNFQSFEEALIAAGNAIQETNP